MIKISKGKPPSLSSKKWSPELCNFVDCCLKKDPKERSTCDELLAHPFLKLANAESKQQLVQMINHKKQIKFI